MTDGLVGIHPFETDDLEAVVEFSVRAWEPVFASLRNVLGEDVFRRLHPDWRFDQAESVRSSCTNPDPGRLRGYRERPVGWVRCRRAERVS